MTDRFSPFDDADGIDLTSVGLTVDDLDLDDIDIPDDLETILLQHPRWQKREWYHTTEAEETILDLPDFESAAQRARYFIKASARLYLDQIGADDDAKVLPHRDRMVSLNDLLATVDDAQSRLSVDWDDVIDGQR